MSQFKTFFVGIFVFANFASAQTQKPSTVTELDLVRYQGTWHQLAYIPVSFQRSCVANTTADYSLLPDGNIQVVNSCQKANGKMKIAHGRARLDPKFNEPGKLQVTFVKIFGWIWAFSGEYWVMDLADDYSVSLVGHPSYKYGWVLSRSPTLSQEGYQAVRQALEKQGYDTCQFAMSTTPSQTFNNNERLCDITGSL